jgi:hypothetical protein
MAEDRVITGAVAIVKVKGVVVARMKDFRYQETLRRLRVGGIGTIMASEKPVVEFDASLTCDFMAVDMESSGIPGAIKRDFDSARSQVATGGASFEDNMVLNLGSVVIDCFEKIGDGMDSNGNIIPKLKLIGTIQDCLIEGDSFSVGEAQLAGRNQSFTCLTPLVAPKSIKNNQA